MSNAKIEIEFDADLVEATCAGKVFQADVTAMPNESLVRIFKYGFQRIMNDHVNSKGSGKTDEAKHEIAVTRRDKIMAGDWASERTAGVSDPHRAYRTQLNEDIKAMYTALHGKADKVDDRIEWFDGLDDDTQTVMVDNARSRLAAMLAVAESMKK